MNRKRMNLRDTIKRGESIIARDFAVSLVRDARNAQAFGMEAVTYIKSACLCDRYSANFDYCQKMAVHRATVAASCALNLA